MRGWLAELFLRQGRWVEAADTALQVVTNENATPMVRYPAVMALARLRMRGGDPSIDELFAELSRFLVKGMELQRLAPYASMMAERAWLEMGDPTDALRLIDRATNMAPSRAIFVGELILWRRMLSPEVDPGDTTGVAKPYQLHFAGDWKASAAKWEELGAPFERGLALLAGDDDAQRTALALFELARRK